LVYSPESPASAVSQEAVSQESQPQEHLSHEQRIRALLQVPRAPLPPRQRRLKAGTTGFMGPPCWG